MEDVHMLYFRFNLDNFVAPQQEGTVTMYKDGKPISSPRKETCEIDMGEIQSFFFKKLRDELCLSVFGYSNAFDDVIDIPVDAFSFDDEEIGNFDGTLKFVLSEYAGLPIKELDNKSLSDLGIGIEFCKRVLNKEIDLKIKANMQKNNIKYITEEVLWKNMTDDEKVNKFLEYLKKNNSKINELIIVDPYIFYSTQDDYCQMLASILGRSGARTIIIVTDQRNYKQASCDKISKKANKIMDKRFNDDFHDRFWIVNRKQGFYTGTSFNGVGKKISLINMIPDDDVMDIIDELYNQSLIS